MYTPWVHWPETMVSYLKEEQILFSCDFFGSHLASSALYVTDECRVHESAKRYFAEIMTPFRPQIAKNLDKLSDYDIRLIRCRPHTIERDEKTETLSIKYMTDEREKYCGSTNDSECLTKYYRKLLRSKI